MNQNFEEIDDFNNFEELLSHFERVVDNRPNSDITVMTVTGLTKVLEDISDAIYEDLLMILPWSILFTVLDNYCIAQVAEGSGNYWNYQL